MFATFLSLSISARRCACALIGVAAVLPATTWAAYPDKPIRIVVPYPPGGSSDSVARLIGQRLQQAWGRPVIVENKPGADTQIGAEFVAKADPDGYTLGVFAPSIVLNRFLYPRASYDLLRDLRPVAGLVTTPAALVVASSSEFKTLRDFVTSARSHPLEQSFSTAASNGFFGIELFNRAAGIRSRHVPYKGSAPSVLAVATGEVGYTIDFLPNVAPLVEAGRLRILGISTPARRAESPDVPTLAEMAPGFEFSGWIMMLAPAGVPAETLMRLNREINRILGTSDVKGRIQSMGAMPLTESMQALSETLKSDVSRFGDVMKNIDFSVKN